MTYKDRVQDDAESARTGAAELLVGGGETVDVRAVVGPERYGVGEVSQDGIPGTVIQNQSVRRRKQISWRAYISAVWSEG